MLGLREALRHHADEGVALFHADLDEHDVRIDLVLAHKDLPAHSERGAAVPRPLLRGGSRALIARTSSKSIMTREPEAAIRPTTCLPLLRILRHAVPHQPRTEPCTRATLPRGWQTVCDWAFALARHRSATGTPGPGPLHPGSGGRSRLAPRGPLAARA